jgi:hypothetical protein
LSVFRSAGRADDFAVAVDGETPSRPLDPDLDAFVALVGSIRTLEATSPRPEFAADLRVRLVAEAEQITPRPAAKVTVRPMRSKRRYTSIAAAACVTIGTGIGVAAASQSAIPGDPAVPDQAECGTRRAQLRWRRCGPR